MASNIDFSLPPFGSATTAGVRNNFIAAKNEIESLQNDVAQGASPSLVIVDSLSNLPAPSGGIITLEDNKAYFFATTVDLIGNRLVCGQNTTLLGSSSENCRIKSTGLATALVTSAWSIPIRGLTIEASIAIDLNAFGNANQAIDWFGVNFTNCASVGTIANYANCVFTDCAFLESSNLTFDGSIDTIAFSQTLFNCNGGSMIIIPDTATINRRIRIIYSSFIVLPGETGISFGAVATVPDDGYILDTVNFGGGGTYVSGVDFKDLKSLWINCRGISNTANVGFMTMQANATATAISATSTPVKVAGTTILSDDSQKFTHSNNRLTYAGALTRSFKITAIASLNSGNANIIGLYIAKNGSVQSISSSFSTTSGAGKAENMLSQIVIELATDDYIEIFTSNETAVTNITVSNLSATAEGLN